MITLLTLNDNSEYKKKTGKISDTFKLLIMKMESEIKKEEEEAKKFGKVELNKSGIANNAINNGQNETDEFATEIEDIIFQLHSVSVIKL